MSPEEDDTMTTNEIARNTCKAHAELSNMLTDPSEAPEGRSKRTDDASGAPGERSERTDDGMAKPAKLSKRVEDAPRASQHAVEVRGHVSKAAADAAAGARPSQGHSG